MQEKKFVRVIRVSKIIQLVILLLIEFVFFLILMRNPSLSRQIYSYRPLFLLCAVIWVLSVFQLLCLIYDFFALRFFARESHELNQAAYLDCLTGIPNRHGLDSIFQTYASPQSMASVGCCMLTIDNLMEVNERQGREVGDQMLCDFSSILEKTGDRLGTVGRNGGNEFLVILNHCTHEAMEHFLTLLDEQLTSYNTSHPDAPILLRSAYVLNSEAHLNAFPQLLVAAYNKLYE